MAVRGVKLKVASDQVEYALIIMNCIRNNKLVDSDGEYDCNSIFENEFKHQNAILKLKNEIRNNPLLLSEPDKLSIQINTDWIDDTELNKIIAEETEFDRLSKLNVKIDARDLWNDIFEYGFHIFEKLRKPVNYFLEKEIVDNYCSKDSEIIKDHCPNCNSDNVRYSNAMDFKWDILFLTFSIFINFLFIVKIPFPIIRSKYHCFDCGFNFKKRHIQ